MAEYSSVRNAEGQEQLEIYIAQATLKYSIKDYDVAAEQYSKATELQAKLNGELSPKNADLLYAYGRCLYHVALRNSDVLGSKIITEKHEDISSASTQKKEKKTRESKTFEPTNEEKKFDEGIVSEVGRERIGAEKAQGTPVDGDKPLFQFTGDKDFDDSDEEQNNVTGEEREQDEEEEDDFVNAYEVLDLARVLLLRNLEEAQRADEGGVSTDVSQTVRQMKERLADIYDLQAEISLEGEKFPSAVTDLRAALELKQELFPYESSIIAEAHYKLSLALEFSSGTCQKDEYTEPEFDTQASVDKEMRVDAIKQMEAAISSCRLRIKLEEAKLEASGSHSQENKDLVSIESNIDDVKDIVNDMEQRLHELRQLSLPVNALTHVGIADGASSLKGVIKSIYGEPPAAQKAKLEEVSEGAADLTNLVKRKKAVAAKDFDQATDLLSTKSNGKRKVEFAKEVIDVGAGKKAKISDVDED